MEVAWTVGVSLEGISSSAGFAQVCIFRHCVRSATPRFRASHLVDANVKIQDRARERTRGEDALFVLP